METYVESDGLQRLPLALLAGAADSRLSTSSAHQRSSTEDAHNPDGADLISEWEYMATVPSCGDCPIGGRAGSGPMCRRARLCDAEAAELVDAHDVRCGLRPDSPLANVVDA